MSCSVWVPFIGFFLSFSQPSSCCSFLKTFISITCSSLIEPDALPSHSPHPLLPLVLALAMLRIDMTIKTNDFGFGFCDFAFMSMRSPLRPSHSALLPLSTWNSPLATPFGYASLRSAPPSTSAQPANACTIFNHAIDLLAAAAAAPDPVLALVLVLVLVVAVVCRGHCLCQRHT